MVSQQRLRATGVTQMIRRTFIVLAAATSFLAMPAFAQDKDAEVTLTLEGGARVNGASVTAADIAATKGVIHVIDAVILPAM